jgi:hypothetical protein
MLHVRGCRLEPAAKGRIRAEEAEGERLWAQRMFRGRTLCYELLPYIVGTRAAAEAMRPSKQSQSQHAHKVEQSPCQRLIQGRSHMEKDRFACVRWVQRDAEK